jgi:PTS system nitrogen regulatory IIA component
MQLIDFLSPENIRIQLKAASKKRALEIASEIAARELGNPTLTTSIMESLQAREKLGSTGIGHGVGIPHCRLPNLKQPMIILLQLEAGIDYNGVDNEPVDIILTLLVPAESIDAHLTLLATIAENFSQASNLDSIRQARDVQSLYKFIANLKHE